MRWDPVQYRRFEDERARPFLDLVSRVGATAPRTVVDLGCGDGSLTGVLAQRWPSAAVHGRDSSPDMIAAARAASDRVDFEVGTVESWSGSPDVLVSNATLQWVPTHRRLLTTWARELPADGWFAFQVPGNFGAPSHVLMRELAESPRWRERLAGVLRHDDAVGEPDEYAALLQDAGLVVDVWQTTYLHVLAGDDPVLHWVRGTGLRPVLAALSDADAAEFEREYAAALRDAYPATPHGTNFAFRRIFAVGHRAAA